MTNPNYLSLTLVLPLLLLSLQSQANHETNEPTDGTVNSFRWLKNSQPVNQASIHDSEGKRISLSRFNGKVVLLNIWASWCAPCIRELPALDRLQDRLGSDEFVVVTVSVDDNLELAQKVFIDQLSLANLKLYIEPVEQLGKSFPVDVIPANFFINRQGQAMGVLRSFVHWDATEVDQLVKRLIGGVDAATLRAEKEKHDQTQ